MAYTERRYELSDLTEVGGGTSLDNNGSATFTTGKSGDAVSLTTASSQYLSVSDSAFNGVSNTDTTEPFTIWGWFNLSATGQNHGIAGQNTSSYHVHVISTDKLRFRVNRATSGNLTLDSTVSLSASTWYWFCVQYEPAVNQASIEVTPASSSTRGVPDTSPINDATGLASGSGPFTIGSIATSNYANALVDAIGFRRNGLLSGDEKDMYFNGGSARSHAEVDTLKGTRPYVYQEFRGIRAPDGTSCSVPVRNLVDGHVATAVICIDGNAGSRAITDWSSAWTTINNTNQAGLFVGNAGFWRTIVSADVSETEALFTWTGSQGASAVVHVWANCGGLNASAVSNTSSSSSSTCPSVTTDVDGCMIVGYAGIDTIALSSITGLIRWTNNGSGTGGGNVYLASGGVYQASLGATGTYAVTAASTTYWANMTLAMEPEAAAAGSVSGSITQGGATLSGTAAALVQASGTLTQGAATASGTAEILVQASGSVTQGGAVLAGTVGTPSIDVSGSLTQGAATLSGSAAVLVQASGTLTQGAATLTGTAAVVVSLSGTLTQGGAVISGAAEDPNNIIADIELSAAPLFNVALAAAPGFNIALSAAPKAS